MAKQKTAAVWTAAEASGLKEQRKALGLSQREFAARWLQPKCFSG